jgi:hypothetical protein
MRPARRQDMVSLLNHHWSRAACLLLASLVLIGTAEASLFKKEGTPDEQRANIRKVSEQALAELYTAQPSAKAHIQKAAGYAVFSNFGVKILVAGGGSGRGIVIDNKTKKETFLDRFINSGWELGAQATASAKVAGQGASVLAGAVAVTPGVWLYQLTDDGLALELTAKGTKYYRDDALN